MKYATSMFYGGALVTATDADHESYKQLGLLCPNCKDPVFLQAPSQRQGDGKLISIPAHFKHFKAKDPALVKVCESRVNKYDAKEVSRRAAQARNQRLRTLQRHFWGIVTHYYEQKMDFPITQILESPGTKQLGAISHWMSNTFFDFPTTELRAAVTQMMDGAYSDGHIFICWNPKDAVTGVIPSTAIQEGFRESLSGKLDRQMQELIVGEVLDFLHSKSSRPLVEKLFLLAACVVFDAMADGATLGLLGRDGSQLMVRTSGGVSIDLSFWKIGGNRQIFYHYAVNHVCLWVAMLPWAYQLQGR